MKKAGKMTTFGLNSAFFKAVCDMDIYTINRLIVEGVDVNIKDERSETPLFKLLSSIPLYKCKDINQQILCKKVTKILVKHGANVNENILEQNMYTGKLLVLKYLVKLLDDNYQPQNQMFYDHAIDFFHDCAINDSFFIDTKAFNK